MKTLTYIKSALLTLPALSLLSLSASTFADSARLQELMTGSHRSADNIARNDARHPVETLEFFGLQPDMTVIEILPSTGWYTEIIAPYVAEEGKFYAAHFSPNASASYMPPNLEAFEEKITANPEVYGRITLRHLNPPAEVAIAPAGSADMALTFRNVHNWIMAEQADEFFATFYTALKPGGVLGVVEHRAPEGSTMEFMSTSGYVSEAKVIELAENAGFQFIAKSEINANPKDTKDYDRGVWTLPPTYRKGDEDRAMYDGIGESDRMTMMFRKPE